MLPVWLLLAPRDYLSTFLKIGVVAALAIGIYIVLPDLRMEAVTRFADGTGPVVSGTSVSVPLHHYRVRRGVGLPRAHLFGHDAEDDRARGPRALHRLRRHANGVLCRDHGAGGGNDARPGDLLRDERAGGGAWPDGRNRGKGHQRVGLGDHAGPHPPDRERCRRAHHPASCGRCTDAGGGHRADHGAGVRRRRRCKRSGITSPSCSRRSSS